MKNSIALLGQPNSGKSTIYNALTGSRQHVGNWPGKTVEKNEGTYNYNGVTYNLTDLPGSYGLTGNSDEEVITVDYIKSGKADLVLVLVDASQLERSMYMLAEFASLDANAVLILNMMDIAKQQNKVIDDKKLSKQLGIPVLPFTAADSKGYDDLKKLIENELKDPHKLSSKPQDTGKDSVREASKAKYEWIDTVLEGVVNTKQADYTLSKFDRLMTRPVLGKLVSIGIILVAFFIAMMICAPFMSIGSMLPKVVGVPVINALTGAGVHPWLVSIFGLLIPNILYFSLSMAAFVFGVNFVFGYLEEVGFLARAAYQFDGIFSRFGLQGKAVCPILMGFGCTIGGASGTRVMDNWGQRMLTMAVVWAVPCGSIWGVVPVVAGVFFTPLQTLLVCIGILVYMIFMMWLVSVVFGKKLSPKEKRSGMIMELPPYHKAHWKHILKEALYKAVDIFKRALGTVTIVSMIFWVFSYSSTGNVKDSLLYKVGTAIEPVTRIFGMGWQTFMGFLSAAFAKEAVLGVLNAIFVGQSSIADATFNSPNAVRDNAALGTIMATSISKPEALAFIFASTFSIPCLMALSTTYKESHSFKWTAKIAGFYVCCALILGCVVYHIAALFM